MTTITIMIMTLVLIPRFDEYDSDDESLVLLFVIVDTPYNCSIKKKSKIQNSKKTCFSFFLDFSTILDFSHFLSDYEVITSI